MVFYLGYASLMYFLVDHTLALMVFSFYRWWLDHLGKWLPLCFLPWQREHAKYQALSFHIISVQQRHSIEVNPFDHKDDVQPELRTNRAELISPISAQRWQAVPLQALHDINIRLSFKPIVTLNTNGVNTWDIQPGNNISSFEASCSKSPNKFSSM